MTGFATSASFGKILSRSGSDTLDEALKEQDSLLDESKPQESMLTMAGMASAMGIAGKKKAAAVAEAAAGLKRQRSISDMFPKSTTPSVKKPRMSAGEGSSSSLVKRPSEVIFGKTPLNSIPFSMSSFKASLDEEQGQLLALECETIGLSWMKLLSEELKKPYFIDLKRFLKGEGVTDASHVSPAVFPPAKEIYTWSKFALGKVRVVILGQDPYHNNGQAHGLCFSVKKGVQTPPSLRNIYTELKTEYPDFTVPNHGDLTAWAQNGVLLLNTCLTVKAHQANSHANKGWEKFTEKIIELVCAYGGASFNPAGVSRGIVFLAWGAPAAKRLTKVDKKKHLVLSSAHPSPLSAHRGFMGNDHFRKANNWLEGKYGAKAKIDWTNLHPVEN